jgi:hypothetical protein
MANVIFVKASYCQKFGHYPSLPKKFGHCPVTAEKIWALPCHCPSLPVIAAEVWETYGLFLAR